MLGYQGQWSGQPGMLIWVHLHFAVLPAMEDGSFPAEIVGLVGGEEPAPDEREQRRPLDPSPYLGAVGSVVMGAPTWLPLRCQVE